MRWSVTVVTMMSDDGMRWMLPGEWARPLSTSTLVVGRRGATGVSRHRWPK